MSKTPNFDINTYLSQVSHRGNVNIRPAGTIITYTEEMIDEMIKCKQDPIYFIKTYIKIIHVDKGLVPFELFPYQEEMIKAYQENRKVITLLFRQAGKTTTTAAFLCWYILFHDEKTCAVLANKASTAREILNRVQTAYEHLPKWMQQGVITWNKGSLELENGSRIIASATSSSGIRGFSISCVAENTQITVRNKHTKEIREIPIGEFAKLIYNSTNANSPIGEDNDSIYVQLQQ
jgi:hypothetical protein